MKQTPLFACYLGKVFTSMQDPKCRVKRHFGVWRIKLSRMWEWSIGQQELARIKTQKYQTQRAYLSELQWTEIGKQKFSARHTAQLSGGLFRPGQRSSTMNKPGWDRHTLFWTQEQSRKARSRQGLGFCWDDSIVQIYQNWWPTPWFYFKSKFQLRCYNCSGNWYIFKILESERLPIKYRAISKIFVKIIC